MFYFGLGFENSIRYGGKGRAVRAEHEAAGSHCIRSQEEERGRKRPMGVVGA